MSEWSIYLDIACQPIPSEDAVCNCSDALERWGFAPAIDSDKNGNVTMQLYVIASRLRDAIDLAIDTFWQAAEKEGVTDIELIEVDGCSWESFISKGEFKANE